MSGPPRRSLAERFWLKVQKGDGCWLWTAFRGTAGYGEIGAGGQSGSTLFAHRVSWELHFGPIPTGLCVLHRCDNRPCVNPAHLFLGTIADNNSDMIAKGRDRPPPFGAGEQHGGAKLTALQVAEIRARAAAGERLVLLARHFGMSSSAVDHLVQRRSWRHVP